MARTRFGEGFHRIGFALAAIPLCASIAFAIYGVGAFAVSQLGSVEPSEVSIEVYSKECAPGDVSYAPRKEDPNNPFSKFKDAPGPWDQFRIPTLAPACRDLVVSRVRRDDAKASFLFFMFAGIALATAAVLYIAARALGWIVDGFRQ